MDNLHLALFEGALLCSSGLPVRYMYDHIFEAYSEDQEINALFKDLKSDWDSPTSSYPFKMIGPFIERETKNAEYTLCRRFTELAAMTAMVDVFWQSCGYGYALKKHITSHTPDESDLKLARQIFTDFQPDAPLMKYLFSLSNAPIWTSQSFFASDESINFNEWVLVRKLNKAPTNLRCLDIFKKEAKRIGDESLVGEINQLWETFSSSL